MLIFKLFLKRQIQKKVRVFTFVLSLLFLNQNIFSQNTFPSSGNSGVGTASPTVPFEIGNTLSQGATIFRFSNPQQNNQILFRDRDISTFMYGIQSNQIKVGATGFDHKIMSIQSNANNITLWPTFSVNSSSNIIINPTGNVGINQASPAYKLDVNGAVNASNFYINGSPISGLTGLWLTSPSNTNNIYYNAGNVGIGTNNPTVPFQIATTLTQGATIFNFGNPQQYNQIIFRDRDISTFMYGVQANQIKVGASGADHKIMSIQSNNQNIEVWPTVAINSPNNILINAGQNVGVGNANPQYKLDVTGTINATQFLVNGSPMTVLSGTGNALSLPTTASLGLGTNSPIYRLDVVGDARISNNLLVGGGIITSQTVNASTQLNAGSVYISNNLNVSGNSNFNGTLTMPALATGSPNTFRPILVDQNGNFITASIGNPNPEISTGCNQSNPFWNVGGNIIAGTGMNDISAGTCDNYAFVLKANGIQRIWLTGTANNGNIGFGIPTPTEKYHFSSGNILLDAGNMVLNNTSISGSNFNKLQIKGAADNTGLVVETSHTSDNLYNTKLYVNLNRTKALSVLNTYANINGYENFLVYGDGQTNIGYQPSSPNSGKLNVNIVGGGGDAFTIFNQLNNQTCFKLKESGVTEIVTNVVNATDDIFTIRDGTLPNTPASVNFKIKKTGKTTIGEKTQLLTHADASLTVNGKIVSREVIVTQLNWADYVFASNYDLPKLNEIEAYYKLHKHLPEIPSEKEIITDGVNIGEMNKLLLKKIEELTIYVVEQEKQIKKLTTQIEKIK